jgi:hypothetical protein
MAVRFAKELTVYIKAYDLAMAIFAVTKRFPKEEQYALTGQIRRSFGQFVKTCVRHGRRGGIRHTS